VTDIVERLHNLLEADPDPAMCEFYAACLAEIARLKRENRLLHDQIAELLAPERKP
jgi:hypothetical protein